MHHLHINFLPVLVATVVRLVLGGVWYAPPLFGKAWSSLTGCTQQEMKARLPKALATDFFAGFVMMLVLAHVVYWAGARYAAEGAFVGFLSWLGFVAAVQLIALVYEKKSFKLFVINSGFLLLTLMIGGVIMAVWR